MTREGDWLQTIDGRQFWPLDPRPEEIDIRVIAHALSMQCRYGGHVQHFYSVAEHCVHIARAVPPADRLWGLLHDASEAYLVDVPRPVKRALDTYQAIERRLMHAVCQRFGLPDRMPLSVAGADHRILLTERAALMAAPPVPWAQDVMVPLPVTIKCWAPAVARAEFLALAEELGISREG